MNFLNLVHNNTNSSFAESNIALHWYLFVHQAWCLEYNLCPFTAHSISVLNFPFFPYLQSMGSEIFSPISASLSSLASCSLASFSSVLISSSGLAWLPFSSSDTTPLGSGLLSDGVHSPVVTRLPLMRVYGRGLPLLLDIAPFWLDDESGSLGTSTLIRSPDTMPKVSRRSSGDPLIGSLPFRLSSKLPGSNLIQERRTKNHREMLTHHIAVRK